MENIKIIRAQTQEDCDICDRFLEELCKFETQFDSTIEPFIGGKHHNLNNILSNNVHLAYAMINGTPAGYIMGYLKNQKGSGNNTNIVNLSTLFVKEEFWKKRVGTTLYTSFENWSKENFGNDFALEVTVINGNDKAFEFYKSLGFSPIRTTFRKW